MLMLQLTHSSQNQEIIIKNLYEIIEMPQSSNSSQESHFQLQLSKVIIVKLRKVLLTSASWSFDTVSAVGTKKFEIAQNCVNSSCYQDAICV